MVSFYTLFSLREKAELHILGSQLPCFRASASTVVRLLHERFHVASTEEQLRDVVNGLVEQSKDSLTTRLYDQFQYYSNGIF